MTHIGRNIFNLVVSRVISGIILFLIYTRLAQYLGPEVAGQYGLLAAYLMVFNMFVDLGMQQLVTKKISENRADAGKYLSNYFWLQLIMGSVFMAVMAGFVYFADYPEIVKNSLYLTSVSLLFFSLGLPFRTVINANQKLAVVAQVNFMNSIINGVFMILAIVFQKSIFFLAFINIAVSLADWGIYALYTTRKFTAFKFEFDKAFAKRLIILSLPFTLLTLFSVYNRIDALMLPHLRSFEENGYYVAAYKFWDVLAFFPAVVGFALYPYFAESLIKNLRDQARASLEAYTRYMIVLAVPLSVGAFALAVPLTQTFYGTEFLPAAPAVWLLVLAVSILFIYTPVNSLIISQQTRTATKITGFTLLFNFTTNLIFIPRYGIAAAAATTVASEIIQLIGYTYVTKRRIINFTFFRHFLKPMVAAAAMYLTLISLPATMSVWFAILIGAVVYAIAVLLLRFFTRADLDLFKAAVSFRAQKEEIKA